MSCVTADRLATRPLTLRSLALALLIALAGATGLGAIASSARAADDPLLPPAGVCLADTAVPGPTLSRSYYGAAARCLINAARANAGKPAMAFDTGLSDAALSKAQDIVRCGVFTHDPCGLGQFSYFPAALQTRGETIAHGANIKARQGGG